MIFRDATATVGRTPLVELGRIAAGLPGRVVAKLEMRNPCGSVKDRLGVALIGLAFAAAIRGYRLILTMPETMSRERVALLRHMGAQVELTPGILMGDAVARAGGTLREA